MRPPIPDPFSGPPPRSAPLPRGPRPPALKTFIGISTLSLLVSALIPAEYSSNADGVTYWTLFVALTILWLTFLWFLGLGRNWARIAVMVGCAVGFLGLFFVGQDQGYYALARQINTILNCVFSAVWFWWLRSPEVVAFFKGSSE